MPEIPSVPGMITPQEQRYLYWLTSQGFTGSGAVVEVGTWLGRSTVHLGAGLKANGYSSHLYCFDKYVWTKQYETPHLNPGIDLENGDDFQPYFEKNVRPVYSNVNVTKTTIDNLIWDNGPIEILFLDAPKSYTDITTTLLKLGSYLMRDLSIVVFQDYLHAPSYPIATVVSTIPQLQLLHVVPASSSVAFFVRDSLSFVQAPPAAWDYSRWTEEKILATWEQILEPLEPQARSFLEPGLCMLLFDHGLRETAINYIAKMKFTPLGRKRWEFLKSHPSYVKYNDLFLAAR